MVFIAKVLLLFLSFAPKNSIKLPKGIFESIEEPYISSKYDLYGRDVADFGSSPSTFEAKTTNTLNSIQSSPAEFRSKNNAQNRSETLAVDRNICVDDDDPNTLIQVDKFNFKLNIADLNQSYLHGDHIRMRGDSDNSDERQLFFDNKLVGYLNDGEVVLLDNGNINIKVEMDQDELIKLLMDNHISDVEEKSPEMPGVAYDPELMQQSQKFVQSIDPSKSADMFENPIGSKVVGSRYHNSVMDQVVAEKLSMSRVQKARIEFPALKTLLRSATGQIFMILVIGSACKLLDILSIRFKNVCLLCGDRLSYKLLLHVRQYLGISRHRAITLPPILSTLVAMWLIRLLLNKFRERQFYQLLSRWYNSDNSTDDRSRYLDQIANSLD